MNREPEEQNATSTAETAAAWFVRLQDEAASGDDWLAFEAWLSASPDHQAAYERVERLWIELDEDGSEVETQLDAPVSLEAYRSARKSGGVSRRGWMLLAGGLAASVAVGAVGISSFTGSPAVAYETAPGQTRQVTLADGTKVWMNASSKIVVRFDRRARRVEMADAEAIFDVTHDPDRPFLITAGDRQIRVVGTEFNLRHRQGDVALTVRRGVVEVRPTGSPQATPTRVSAGHRLVHERGEPSSVVTVVQPDGAFAWSRGQLVYEDAPLSEVASDLSRSLAVPVRLADPADGRIRFSGVLTLDDRAAVMRRLEAFAPVKVERRPGELILRRR